MKKFFVLLLLLSCYSFSFTQNLNKTIEIAFIDKQYEPILDKNIQITYDWKLDKKRFHQLSLFGGRKRITATNQEFVMNEIGLNYVFTQKLIDREKLLLYVGGASRYRFVFVNGENDNYSFFYTENAMWFGAEVGMNFKIFKDYFIELETAFYGINMEHRRGTSLPPYQEIGHRTLFYFGIRQFLEIGIGKYF